MSDNDKHIWGFDIGKASLGEAVRIGLEFKHVQSLILDKDFAGTKSVAFRRRQMRTRKAHKEREKWLEKCLADCGIEILKRREVGIVNGQWKLISEGDARLEKEFPPRGENICYNSIALRCKLILGERLESWQVFKALNSAIQHRGYDVDILWDKTQTPEKNDSEDSLEGIRPEKNDAEDSLEGIKLYDKEIGEMLNELPDGLQRELFEFPCFFKAYKMGIWSPLEPDRIDLRITNQAQKAKGYVVPRKSVESEFVKLVEMASLQYPKLEGKAKFILYGITETPYASFYPNLRREFGLKRGADSDWTALGQKIPRFDNRIIDKCKLIPRLNVCKIKPLNEINTEDGLLHYDIVLALKLLNFRFFKDSSARSLSFDEFKELFEIGKANKYKITKSVLKKFLKSIGADVLGEDQSEVEAPRSSGRSSFSRPAMRMLKELIFSGRAPADFYREKIGQITNTNPERGLVASDLDFIKLMGDCPWNGIFIPDVETYLYAERNNANSEAQINKLIGSQNDPIVRHRLAFFYDRLKVLTGKFGVPDEIVLEFVREDFMGKKARDELSAAIKKRFNEKMSLAEKLDEIGFKGGKMLLKLELLQKQGCVCLYTGEPLKETDLPELEIEHIVPRSRGGPDAKYNYVLTHESTNKIKADRTPFEWLSGNKVKWQAYVDRVRARAKELGAKRCKLLLGENSEELVEKYAALSETAWISKLAQRIACMHFGFQFGGNTGQKRVFTVPGNVTARIRGTFKLNRILNNEDKDRGDMSELDIVKLDYELDKKNRKNKKHHALDAMCLCFAPTGADAKRAKIETLLPPKIASCAEAYFRGYIDKITPVEVGTKKASLEDGIYSKRVIDGKVCIVRRFELKELAYKSVQNKPVYSILALRKLLKKNSKKIDPIINPIIRGMVRDFVEGNPDEEAWINWCDNARMPSESGMGSRITRVLVYVGTPDEYKDLSKDACGAFRKGDYNKGQIVWENKSHKYIVAPIYVHSSRKAVMESVVNNPDFLRIAGIFRKHCLVKIDDSVLDKNGAILLSAGVYMVNTIQSNGFTVLTDSNGVKSQSININYLMKAGMKLIRPEK